MSMTSVMVDLETTGLNVGFNAVIQLAAVKFNLETGEIDHNFFDRCLMIPPTRFWDEGTREWWLKDKREVLLSILGRGEDPLTVLQDFRTWVQKDQQVPLKFVGKPISFDFAFLQHYFNSYGMPMPFHYRYSEDMNTWIRARHWPNDPPNFERDIEFEGPAHNALFDVFHQIKVLFAARDATKQMIFVP